MNKTLYKIAGLALVLLLAGCSVFRPTVDSNTTVFLVPGFKVDGSIAVVAADEKVARSLEFSHYRARFEEKLKAVGYRIEADTSAATYLALVAYGIDNGETAVVTTPVFGQTSAGYYIGDHYIMPSYGVVDVVSRSVTSFTRAIALDIVVAQSFKTPPIVKVYEARTKSVGECPVMVEVFDEMLEALFEGFPGVHATNRKSSVRAVINC